jgi:hypothetical protein
MPQGFSVRRLRSVAVTRIADGRERQIASQVGKLIRIDLAILAALATWIGRPGDLGVGKAIANVMVEIGAFRFS